MIEARGYAIVHNDWGGVNEYDTFTCPHCNGVQVIRPGSGTKRGYCGLCHAPTCGREQCAECVPFKQKLETMENRYRLRCSF
jgi:hypothetical protein